MHRSCEFRIIERFTRDRGEVLMSSEQTKAACDSARGLHQSQEIPTLLVNGVTDFAIFMIDTKGVILTWNTGAERLKGYIAQEIVGQHFSCCYTNEARADDLPQRELDMARASGRFEGEDWQVRKDGSKFRAHVVMNPVYYQSELIGFARVTREITEKEQSVWQQSDIVVDEAEIFRLLVTSVKDYAIFMLDPMGRVMTWNNGAQLLNGYACDEIIGQHFSKFYTEQDKRAGHPDRELQIAKELGRYEEEGWRVRKDGTTFWSNVVITTVYERDELVGFAKVTRDLTERRALEQSRETAAKLLAETNEQLQRALEIKTRFLSTISHEVRTPMGAIIGMTELLTLNDLGEDNNKIVGSIFESSNRLLALLNDMLDAARMESGKLKIESRLFPVRTVLLDVEQLIKPQAAKKNLEVGSSCNFDVPEMLCGDETRLRQILLNLAFNAVKFTDYGSVKITCSVKTQQNDTTVARFEISDTGIGIEAEAQSKLFQPFEQAHDSITRLHGGSGLGLHISKNLIELMHGKIGVSSDLGKGSVFWFEIPFKSGNCKS